MSDVRIGIRLELEEVPQEIDKRLQEIDRELEKKNKAFTVLSNIFKQTTISMRELTKEGQKLQKGISSQAKESVKASTVTKEMVDRLSAVTSEAEQSRNIISDTSLAFSRLRQEFIIAGDKGRELASKIAQQRLSLEEITETIREYAKEQGLTSAQISSVIRLTTAYSIWTNKLGLSISDLNKLFGDYNSRVEALSNITAKLASENRSLSEIFDLMEQAGVKVSSTFRNQLSEAIRLYEVTGHNIEKVRAYWRAMELEREALLRVSTSTGMFKQYMWDLVNIESIGADKARELSTVLGMNAEQLQLVSNALKGNIQSVSQLVDLHKALAQSAFNVQERAEILRSAFMGYARQVGITGRISNALWEAFRAAPEAIAPTLIGLERMNRRLMTLNLTSRIYQATLGVTGRALRNFSISLFWTGLGMMFTTMSIARLYGRQVTMERQTYSLTRAIIRVREAQQRYNEIVYQYGAASEEARRAAWEVKEAELALNETRRSAINAIVQQRMALWMYIFGVVPSVLRFGSSLADLFTLLAAKRQADAYLTLWQAAATGTLTKAQLVAFSTTMGLSGAHEMLSGSKMKGAVASGALQRALAQEQITKYMDIATTMKETAAQEALNMAKMKSVFLSNLLKYNLAGLAISAAMFGGMILYMNYQMQEANRMMEEQMKKAEELASAYGPHSLNTSVRSVIDSMVELKAEMKDVNREVRMFPVRHGSRMEVRTSYGWTELEAPTLYSINQPTSNNVCVNINGPVYIRREEDIRRLAREIGREISRAQMRSVMNWRGGRV